MMRNLETSFSKSMIFCKAAEATKPALATLVAENVVEPRLTIFTNTGQLMDDEELKIIDGRDKSIFQWWN